MTCVICGAKIAAVIEQLTRALTETDGRANEGSK